MLADLFSLGLFSSFPPLQNWQRTRECHHESSRVEEEEEEEEDEEEDMEEEEEEEQEEEQEDQSKPSMHQRCCNTPSCPKSPPQSPCKHSFSL